MANEEIVEPEPNEKSSATILCRGCGKFVRWKSCRAVTVMESGGWDHRWYCMECYEGFEYGRDF